MSTDDCKEYLTDRFPETSKKDWKRLSKKKKSHSSDWIVRVFENKTTGQLASIYSFDEDDECLYLSTDPEIAEPWWFKYDPVSNSTMFGIPGEDHGYSVECGQFIFDLFGLLRFQFDEVSDNCFIDSCSFSEEEIKSRFLHLGFIDKDGYTLPEVHNLDDGGKTVLVPPTSTTHPLSKVSPLDDIMKEVNGEYFALFPYDSKEYIHVEKELPWDIVSDTIVGSSRVLVLKLGDVIATVIDDGKNITVKDSSKWYFYINDYGPSNGDDSFGFGVYPEFNKENSEYGFTLCSQTYDLDPSFDETAEMYIEIDHSKYKTKEDLISYLEGKGLKYDPEADFVID